MRRGLAAAVTLLAAAALVGGATNCGLDATAGASADASPSEDVNGDASPLPDGTPPASPFGLDTRPANATCKVPARPPGALGAKVVLPFPVLPQLVNPVVIQKVPGKPSWWVVERAGKVWSFDDTPTAASFTSVLDIATNVESSFAESGLVGVTFHPKFAVNGFVYMYYTHTGGPTNFNARLSRFHSSDAGLTVDPSSEKVLLDVPRAITQHLGGHLAFGPDGFLYLGFGEGGYPDHAQLTTDTPCDDAECPPLLGKFLRIDVDTGDPYGIPPSNPFAQGGGRKEIYAWGFRNPFAWSFDRATGELWAGDVGESSFEEIDRVERGGNYGWPLLEGKHCRTPGTCDGKGLIDPVVEHPHPEASAIIAGPVYRGTRVPGLIGSLVYGDEVGGTSWALVANAATGAYVPTVLNPSGPAVYVTSYAEDTDGEVFMTDYSGHIYTLVPDGSPTMSSFPTKLTETGCVDTSDPRKPAPGLVPYGIVAPFWSDGADKERFFALPDGRTITIGAEGDLDLPVGTVTMKTFSLAGKRIETRLFVRHDDGDWAGYSYEWNDAQTDATLLPAGKVKDVGGQAWTFPSRTDCLRCHTKVAGGTLGLELQQLARPFDYPGRPGRSQLATLDHIGLFASPLPTQPVPLPPTDGTATLEVRARAYLHANCSFCHRPGGPTLATMDLRFDASPVATKTCGLPPLRGDLGIAGAALVKPGAVASSILSRRMHATDFSRMPPVASHEVDPIGTALIDAWIAGLMGCP